MQKESQHEASIKAAESLDFSQAPWMENANQMQTPAVAVVMAAEQVSAASSTSRVCALIVGSCATYAYNRDVQAGAGQCTCGASAIILHQLTVQCPCVAVQRNRPQEENTQTFGQATFFTDDAKSDITSRSPGNSNRQLLGDVEVSKHKHLLFWYTSGGVITSQAATKSYVCTGSIPE